MREYTDKIKLFTGGDLNGPLEEVENDFDDWYASMAKRYNFEVKKVEFAYTYTVSGGGRSVIAMCWYRIYNK